MSVLYIRGEDNKFYPVTTIQGATGAPGYTPVKGKDYFTHDEISDIANQAAATATAALQGDYVAKNQDPSNVGKILVVGADGNLTLADMPTGGGDVVGMIDENNNIVITGALADGTYTFKYENADGTYADIGSLVVKSSGYTNLISEIGFEDDMRLGSSNGGQTKAQSGIVTIGYIDRADYDQDGATETIIRIRGLDPTAQPSYSGVCFYVSGTLEYTTYYALNDILSGTKGGVTGSYDSTTGVLTLTCSKTSMSNGSVFRICAEGVGANLVVTANEEITD